MDRQKEKQAVLDREEIKKLIKEGYKNEQLVLIENEFGEIGIDGGFLKEAGIKINEMNSGCICCSLVGDFRTALTKVLEEYSDYLQDEGFTVTCGSEHNTPAMEPIKLRTSDHPEGLSEKLRQTNFKGACKVVAHQAGKDSADAGEEIILRVLNS